MIGHFRPEFIKDMIARNNQLAYYIVATELPDIVLKNSRGNRSIVSTNANCDVTTVTASPTPFVNTTHVCRCVQAICIAVIGLRDSEILQSDVHFRNSAKFRLGSSTVNCNAVMSRSWVGPSVGIYIIIRS